MLEASCHCRAVRVAIETMPTVLQQCNCSLCRRLGAIWAYDAPDALTVLSGKEAVVGYEQSADATRRFFHCSKCACPTHYRTLPDKDVTQKVGLNVRAVDDVSRIAHLPIEMFDGADTWTVLWTRPDPDLFG